MGCLGANFTQNNERFLPWGGQGRDLRPLPGGTTDMSSSPAQVSSRTSRESLLSWGPWWEGSCLEVEHKFPFPSNLPHLEPICLSFHLTRGRGGATLTLLMARVAPGWAQNQPTLPHPRAHTNLD